MSYLNWGKVLREYRLRNGLKQDALASELGVDQPSVSRWERSGIVPNTIRAAILKKLYEEDEIPFHMIAATTHSSQHSMIRKGPYIIAISDPWHGGRLRAGDILPDYLYQYALDNEEAIEQTVGSLFRGEIAAVRIRRPWYNLIEEREEMSVLLYEPIRLFDGDWASKVTVSIDPDDIASTPEEPVVATVEDVLLMQREWA